MDRYDSYKDSGVKWIGEIPNGWNVTKLKYTKKDSRNSFIDGDWIESKDLSDDGIRYITSGNIGEGKYKEQGSGYISEDTFNELNCTELFEGELVISRLFLPVGRSCILPNLNNRVITCVDNVVLRPKDSFNKFYLNYQFNSSRYSEFTELISRGVTLTRISRGMLGNNSIVVPSLSEQQQIVSFLDDKTQKIDSLIQQKEKKIELLKEKRISLINHVVTKGLDPNVEMKDSGVEWIGEIPSSWEITKMKYGVNHLSKKGKPEKKDIKISPENVESGTGVCFNLYSEHESEGMRFQSGDILLNKLRLYLKKILFTDYDGFSLGEMIVLRTNNKLNNKYFYQLLFSQGLIDLLDSQSTGIKLPRVSPDVILNTEIVYPPLNEQQQIVEYLDKQTEEIDTLIQLEQKKIDTLKEYRQSLISEVVTGKIRVCEEDNSLSLNSQIV
jgi:type I restriction enzyme S subunit